MYGPCLSPIVGGQALTPPTRHSLGEPLPHQQADRTQAPLEVDVYRSKQPLPLRDHLVLSRISPSYPRLQGRFLRVTNPFAMRQKRRIRLACLIHAASVHPELGSNSQ